MKNETKEALENASKVSEQNGDIQVSAAVDFLLAAASHSRECTRTMAALMQQFLQKVLFPEQAQ